MDSAKNDCYFYYYSTCSKGEACPFRHEPLALKNEVVCSFWKTFSCVKEHCPFRHMEPTKDRSAIPCYWENQQSGCSKSHCPFSHAKPKKLDENLQSTLKRKRVVMNPPASDGDVYTPTVKSRLKEDDSENHSYEPSPLHTTPPTSLMSTSMINKLRGEALQSIDLRNRLRKKNVSEERIMKDKMSITFDNNKLIAEENDEPIVKNNNDRKVFRNRDRVVKLNMNESGGGGNNQIHPDSTTNLSAERDSFDIIEKVQKVEVKAEKFSKKKKSGKKKKEVKMGLKLAQQILKSLNEDNIIDAADQDGHLTSKLINLKKKDLKKLLLSSSISTNKCDGGKNSQKGKKKKKHDQKKDEDGINIELSDDDKIDKVENNERTNVENYSDD